MHDGETLADYPTLEHGTTVFVVIRLPGGGGARKDTGTILIPVSTQLS